MKHYMWLIAIALVGCTTEEPELSTAEQLLSFQSIPNGVPVKNAHGFATTISTAGSIDLTNEFFQDLGENGRRCVTCHLPTAGWTITPEQVRAVFEATQGGVIDDGLGLGAIFRLNDGANSPNADVSTLKKRRAAYSMLLRRGVIRVGIGMPANADFELIAVDDPYGYASATELSFFRRPLPSTNLKFLSAVMWDGRETFAGQSMHFNLSHQANGATEGHAEGDPLTDAQRDAIVDFELALHTAQQMDRRAGFLRAAGAQGGPDAVIDQDFYIGINDNFGDYETGAPFTPIVFDIYDAWTNSPKAARARIARGQAIFNTRLLNIRGVSGINDEAVFGFPENIPGTCTTCHNSPNAGDHSTAVPLDIGLVAESRRTPDMPLYTFRHIATGEIKRVTDGGRAMITGKFKDLGRFKGPILRGLAARAPYFHDGSAATLEDAVEFYNQRFEMNLTAQEKSDLVAFLRTL